VQTILQSVCFRRSRVVIECDKDRLRKWGKLKLVQQNGLEIR